MPRLPQGKGPRPRATEAAASVQPLQPPDTDAVMERLHNAVTYLITVTKKHAESLENVRQNQVYVDDYCKQKQEAEVAVQAATAELYKIHQVSPASSPQAVGSSDELDKEMDDEIDRAEAADLAARQERSW